MTAMSGPPTNVTQGEQFSLTLIWPEDAIKDAVPATHFLVLNDGSVPTDGTFLVLGQVVPPVWITPEQQRMGMERPESAGMPIKVQGAFYLTRAKARELYGILGVHLGMAEGGADAE
jgi:hypothetical protein